MQEDEAQIADGPRRAHAGIMAAATAVWKDLRAHRILPAMLGVSDDSSGDDSDNEQYDIAPGRLAFLPLHPDSILTFVLRSAFPLLHPSLHDSYSGNDAQACRVRLRNSKPSCFRLGFHLCLQATVSIAQVCCYQLKAQISCKAGPSLRWGVTRAKGCLGVTRLSMPSGLHLSFCSVGTYTGLSHEQQHLVQAIMSCWCSGLVLLGPHDRL